MNIFNKTYQRINKHKKTAILGIIGILIIVLLVSFGIKHNNKKNQPSTVNVKVGTIKEEVYASGKVKAIKSLDLAFRNSGQVSQVLVKEGEEVKKGQVLASLNNDDLWARLKQAQANKEAEEARLQEMEKGARPEEISIKKTALSQARQGLEDYYQNAWNVLSDAYTKAENAIKIQLKDVFVGAEAAGSYQLTFDTCVPQLTSDVDDARLSAERKLHQWKEEVSVLNPSSSPETIDEEIKNTEGYLVFFQSFINKLNNILLADCSFSNPYLDPYRVSANTAKGLIISAFGNVSALEQNIKAQKLLVQKSQDELALLLAGSTKEAIAAQAAKVKSAQASVSNCLAQIEKGIIRAPFDGVITKKDIKVGDIITANTPVITLMSREGLEIESYVSEMDAVKLKKGDKATVTLDAYGENITFPAEVASIDLGPTIKNDITTYKTILYFTGKTDLIKPGMSADINIITNRHEDVLVIPLRAVITEKGKQFVRVIDTKGNVSLRPIKTGLRNLVGDVEVKEGLKKGEKIIVK